MPAQLKWLKDERVGSSRWTAHASSQLGFTAFDVYDDRMVIKAIDTANAVYDESHMMRHETRP